MDPKVAVSTAEYGIRPQRTYLLRDDADIRLLAAVICKAVVAEAIVEPTEQHDVVLEPYVRSTPTTTASAAAESPATASESSTAPKSPATAESSTTAECGCSMSPASEPRPSAAESGSRSEMSSSRNCAG